MCVFLSYVVFVPWVSTNFSYFTIMSSSPSLFAFCDGVRDEFEGFTRGLLGSIARDYQLKEQELVTRYLTSHAPHGSPVSQALVQSLAPRPPSPPLAVLFWDPRMLRSAVVSLPLVLRALTCLGP